MRKHCEYIPGAYDRCLDCQYLGNGCDGPRTTSMSNERWLWWVKALKQLKGYTNQDCIDSTGLSKGTIENIFSGNSKDIMRSTVGILEDFLIGSSGKWPCAMDINVDKNIVYQDRPETIEMLAMRGAEIDTLRHHLDELREIMNKEVDKVREESQAKIDFLKDQIQKKDAQIDRQNKVIDKLMG